MAHYVDIVVFETPSGLFHLSPNNRLSHVENSRRASALLQGSKGSMQVCQEQTTLKPQPLYDVNIFEIHTSVTMRG
eukprot:1185182-Prorocentrum_minimum.AAC.1